MERQDQTSSRPRKGDKHGAGSIENVGPNKKPGSSPRSENLPESPGPANLGANSPLQILHHVVKELGYRKRRDVMNELRAEIDLLKARHLELEASVQISQRKIDAQRGLIAMLERQESF